MSSARIFQDQSLPSDASLAGWAALTDKLGIQAPVRRPSCIANHHVRGSIKEEGVWRVFDKRYGFEDTLTAHLTFALKHEDFDILVLKRVLEALPKDLLVAFILSSPTGSVARRVWFFYEYLLDKVLDIPDAPKAGAVDAIDPKAYFTGKGILSTRHRVRNNLLGTRQFSPVIRRTERLETYRALGLSQKAKESIGRVSAQLVARAASFMLLADSRASFEIEGERPPRNRLDRWGRAIMQSGKHPLTLEEMVRLQGVLIEDNRFIQMGLRSEGVFLGERSQGGEP
ncbi:MAG: hypothetical protein U0003_05005, partial [Vampirovibrionales bacterium]